MSGPAGRYRRAERRESLWPLAIIPVLWLMGALIEGLWL